MASPIKSQQQGNQDNAPNNIKAPTKLNEINNNTNDQNNCVAFLNTGSTQVAVKFGPTGLAAPTLPVSGSTTGDFVLPASMTVPLIFAVPTTPTYVRMIGSAAGPSIVYVTPVGA